jgi:hypothetical protein
VGRILNCLMLNLMVHKINVSIRKVSGLTKSYGKLVLQILTLYRSEGKPEHCLMSESNITLNVNLSLFCVCVCV